MLLNPHRFASAGGGGYTVMSAGLKSGLLGYYSLDDTYVDAVNPSNEGKKAEPCQELCWNYFNSTLDLPTATNATLSFPANNNSVVITASGADPNFFPASFSGTTVAGSTYRYIHLRIKRTAGTSWAGQIFYSTSGHGISGSFYKTFSDPTGGVVSSTWYDVYVDMHALTVGGTDWATGTITGLRIDLGSTGSAFEIDYLGLSASSSAINTFSTGLTGKRCVLSNGGIALPKTLQTTGSQTWAMWVTGSGFVLTVGTDKGDGWGMQVSDGTTSVSVQISSGGSSYNATNTYGAIDLSVPRLYIVTFNGAAGTLSMTVNSSTQTTSGTGSTIRGSAGGVWLGLNRTFPDFIYHHRRVSGSFEDVGMWNRALSASERTELYNSGNGVVYS